MRKLIAAAGTALLLAGCAGNIRLLEEGKTHPGRFGAGKAVEATIDGEAYKGTFTQGVSVGFTQANATAFSGTRSAVASSTGTTIGSSGNGQAFMRSESGKVIQCVFQAFAGQGQGTCEGLDGRRFVLIIGE